MMKSLQGQGGRPGGLLRIAVAGVCVLVGFGSGGFAAEPLTPSAIQEELLSFQQFGSVLYVAAHPDDENTQLIGYFARGRGYRTAYLSVTRGDGGQNVLGPEFGDELGVIRTQELLAARRIDHGRQFFTRAIDFGFCKDYREALRIWDRQEVLADIVRVIREFQPDVVITRFSPEPGNTHGHHTASAVLALEAFKLAGDPKAFPDQLGELKPWQPKRIFWNGGGFLRVPESATNVLHLDDGGKDPVMGESFSDIAGHSRSMHKTQGFGNFTGFGGRGGGRAEAFILLAGEPATNDIMDGIDTRWSRFPGGAEIGQQAGEIAAKFDPKDPAASVPALLKLHAELAALPSSPIVDEKRKQLDLILQGCIGLAVKTTVAHAEIAPDDRFPIKQSVILHSDVPVRWMGMRYPAVGRDAKEAVDLRRDVAATREFTPIMPANASPSQPYWLREDHTPGMFRVDNPSLIGRPENPPVYPVEYIFEVGGQTLVVPDEPVAVAAADSASPETIKVIAPVSLHFTSDVKLFAPGSARPVELEVTGHHPGEAGSVELEVPQGWRAEPASRKFELKTPGEVARLTFTVTAAAQPGKAVIGARAKIGGMTFDNDRIEIRYKHIPIQLLQPPARLEAVALELATRGRRVGYVPGAGDSVAEAVEQMGYEVTQLTGAELTAEKLHGLDAVVIGIRAFNVRTDLSEHMPALFAYVEGGGNVIVQYNRPNDLKVKSIAPFGLEISGDRVTDENATMTFLAPDNPVLQTPNKITNADFEGWVQERGLYFPNQWDEHFTPIFACNDPGEPPRKGSLLVAHYGQGYFVYTGLSWFRQLPAGVPGAYRLFANLVSLGK